MTEYSELSEIELQAVIDKAEQALKDKQIKKRKEVISQIKALAASIGVTVSLSDDEDETKVVRKGKKVAAKYANPDNPMQTWTGRGVSPKWMKALLDAGRDKSEFLINK